MKLAHTTANNWLPSLIDEMFKNDYLGGTTETAKSFVPSINVAEREESYLLELSIPGFSKDEVHIEVDKDVLTIASQVEKIEEDAALKFTRREFGKKSFKRSFNLPETVNQNDIDASYKNGVLLITLPKKEEALPLPKRKISLK
ncbi:Hsp20/alpha crystallin family protein [Nonlabens sp. Asnod3-A02]|uniref:Hsp20/alpha crystallin family protein n=1 Tax=Nonlabens sp. Asnod3-A02 TaxID=3160579 RepID=UPI00386B09F1